MMKTKNAYVIVNSNQQFARVRGDGRFDWVTEYPDATEWHNAEIARRALLNIKKHGYAVNVYHLIENYGADNQRTVFRLDMLTGELN